MADCCTRTIFYTTEEGLPEEGRLKRIYINQTTGEIFIWDGDSYVAISGGVGGLSYFQEGIDLVALTPFVVTHSLALTDRDSYVLSAKDVDGNPLEVDYIGIGINSLSITSAVNISDISVTIIGL